MTEKDPPEACRIGLPGVKSERRGECWACFYQGDLYPYEKWEDRLRGERTVFVCRGCVETGYPGDKENYQLLATVKVSNLIMDKLDVIEKLHESILAPLVNNICDVCHDNFQSPKPGNICHHCAAKGDK